MLDARRKILMLGTAKIYEQIAKSNENAKRKERPWGALLPYPDSMSKAVKNHSESRNTPNRT